MIAFLSSGVPAISTGRWPITVSHTVRRNAVLGENPIMPDQPSLVESDPIDRPARQLGSERCALAYMMRRTSSTPPSSSPSRFSLLPSPRFCSRSKLREDMPAAAWSEKEKEESGV